MDKFVIKMLISACILVTLSTSVCSRFIHKIEDYNKPMPEYVAECRKGCLMKFLDGPVSANTDVECSQKPNCFMCWDYCSMLFKDRKKKSITTLMCTDDVCFAGCKFACNYYRYLLAKPMHRADDFFH